MKLILNNNSEEIVQFDSCSRNLNMGDTDIFFDIYVNSNSLTQAPSMQYITKYADSGFNNIRVMNNTNDVIFKMENINGRIASFNESFGDSYYNASVAFQILKNE